VKLPGKYLNPLYEAEVLKHMTDDAPGEYLVVSVKELTEVMQSRERKAFEAGRDRNPGYHSWDPNSGYSSCDAEMRGTTYHVGEEKHSNFDDYLKSEAYND